MVEHYVCPILLFYWFISVISSHLSPLMPIDGQPRRSSYLSAVCIRHHRNASSILEIESLHVAQVILMCCWRSLWWLSDMILLLLFRFVIIRPTHHKTRCHFRLIYSISRTSGRLKFAPLFLAFVLSYPPSYAVTWFYYLILANLHFVDEGYLLDSFKFL